MAGFRGLSSLSACSTLGQPVAAIYKLLLTAVQSGAGKTLLLGAYSWEYPQTYRPLAKDIKTTSRATAEIVSFGPRSLPHDAGTGHSIPDLRLHPDAAGFSPPPLYLKAREIVASAPA